MTERMNERFVPDKLVRICAGGSRYLASLMFMAAWIWAMCSMPMRANAGTIIVEGTLAIAGANEDPLLAMFEKSNALATSKAIADVACGHLGALVSVLPGGAGASADALTIIGLSFQDQKLREAFPWDSAPRYLLRDRDQIFEYRLIPKKL